ncbi:MAG TPA: hypothetical protein PKV86_00750 [Syntrophobacteraceae bacterium]|nr:hypothetical protein [Syntrophobacteraceae bacterium]
MDHQLSEEQGRHHHHGPDDHCCEHAIGPVKALSLSAKEKLIIRIDRFLKHNSEHADHYRELADTAVAVGGEEAARQIRAAMACIIRQNEHLEQALVQLKAL